MLSALFLQLPTRLAIFWRAHFTPTSSYETGRKEPPSFLIFRLDALGDVVLTTPLFAALKESFPRSRCTVVVQGHYKPLLATNAHVDEIITLPNLTSRYLPLFLRRFVAALVLYCTELRARHFDYAVSPRWDADEHLATFLCALTRATHRVGYTSTTSPVKARLNRGFDSAFDICLPAGPLRHEVERNLVVAEALGAAACNRKPEIRITEHDRRLATKLLTGTVQGEKLVALGIGAASPGRRWPAKSYVEVIAQLARLHRIRPVILCSGAELADGRRLSAELGYQAVLVAGASLREVCAVLEHCSLFIGNDSGCAHLAAAMDCPTIVVSRHPRDGDPNHFNSPSRFRPYCARMRALQPATGIEGCRDACTAAVPHCIRQIRSEEVAAAASEMLNVRWPAAKPLAQDSWMLAATQRLLRTHSPDAVRHALDALVQPRDRPSL